MAKRRYGVAFVLAVLSAASFAGVMDISGTATAAQEGDYYYEVTDGKATITGYSGPGGNLSIPSALGGYPTAGIGEWAFQGRSNIISVTMPGTVASIGNGSFYYCTSLASVTIPSSVASIGNGAFRQCGALASVTIPKSVTSIGNGAFSQCASLAEIEVEVPNPCYASADGVLYDRSMAVLIQCPGGRGGEFIVPDGVAIIGEDAFNGCAALTSVTMGGVVSICDAAFYSCGSLTTIEIPESVASIGTYVFSYCSSLTAIDVDAANQHYASVAGALYDRSMAVLIQCPEGKAGAFTVPDGVARVGDYAFSDCADLTSVTIPGSVAEVGAGAFSRCASLAAIEVDAANQHYASVAGALYDRSMAVLIQCPGGKAGAFTVPDGVASIGDDAFNGCAALTSVMIGDGVQRIGGSAFSYCTALTSVMMTGSLSSIGDGAFYYCTSLASVTIPGSVSSIGAFAFEECASLASVTIGNGVVSMGDWAFIGCAALTSVTVPESVTNIGFGAFAFCAFLEAIDVDAANSHYASADGVLYDRSMAVLIQCPGGKAGAFTVPDGVVTIESSAFNGCTALTSMTITGNVTSIGEYAFSHCSLLTSIAFTGLVAPAEVGDHWILGVSTDVRGHALPSSSFPPPGQSFHGLVMGQYIPEPPGSPSVLSATAGAARVTLTWSAPVFNGSGPVLGYRLYYGTSSPPSVQFGPMIVAGNLTAEVTGLMPGTVYYFGVKAVNAAGDSPMSNVTSAVPYTVPGAPMMVSVAPGTSNVTIAWSAPSFDGGSPVLGYKTFYGTGSSAMVQFGGTIDPSRRSVDVTNLASGTTYQFAVKAVNAAGDGNASSPMSAKTLPSASGDSAALYAGIVIAVVLVAAMALLLARRRGR